MGTGATQSQGFLCKMGWLLPCPPAAIPFPPECRPAFFSKPPDVAPAVSTRAAFLPLAGPTDSRPTSLGRRPLDHDLGNHRRLRCDQHELNALSEAHGIRLTLGQGEGRTESHRILEVESELENGKHLYHISYYGEGNERDYLRFYHNVQRNGEIVLKNQPGIRWIRGEPGA